MLAYNNFDRMSLENKAGSVQLIENGYVFAVSEPNSWIGVRYDYGLDPNNIYSLKFKASAEKEGSILEIEVHDNTRSFSAFSFIIGKTEKQYSFGLASPLGPATAIPNVCSSSFNSSFSSGVLLQSKLSKFRIGKIIHLCSCYIKK